MTKTFNVLNEGVLREILLDNLTREQKTALLDQISREGQKAELSEEEITKLQLMVD